MKNVTLTSAMIKPDRFPEFGKYFIGFDQLFDAANQLTTSPQCGYPPYNVIQTTEDNYQIELAVAGFGESDLTLSLDNGMLLISGEQKSQDENIQYIHRGLSHRKFQREFRLGEHIEVKTASVQDGIMRIDLERVVPEELKPRRIAINFKN
jgi:molecular chaperone IbpA